ncbi:unnamed protein product [Symbiodinium natans]|uniref:Pseudouridine synthase RsuA/RluA-like domain-containing protein n=1 Tax=Symbiodinium natans TaxID=878477 RepID=A0A812SZC4_9DINO|nr:unnamed protein product [Symbiodinium natans]
MDCRTSTQLLGAVRRSRGQATVFHYNAAVAAERGGTWTAGIQILAELAAADVVASSSCYAGAMKTLARSREQWEWAVEVLLQMEAQSLRRNEIVLSTGLTASARAASWLSALDLFTRMAQEKLEQDAIACTAVVSGFELLGRWQPSLELLRQLPEADVVAYGAVVSACAKAGAWQMAVALLFELSERRALNEVCVNSAITACERAGSWDMALVLLSEMVNQDLRRDTIGVCAAISACARSSQWQAALALYKDMTASLLQPNVIAINAAMHACEKVKQWTVVLHLLWTMPQQRLQHDAISLGSTGMACDSAEQWQWSLQTLGRSPSGAVEDGTLQNFARRLAQQPSLLPEDLQLLRSMCAPAALRRATPQEVVLLVWCMASVGFSEEAILSKLLVTASELLSQGRLTWRDLGHLSWAMANLEVWDLDLLLALQKELLRRLAEVTAAGAQGTRSSTMQMDCGSSALTTIWACTYLGCLQPRMLEGAAEALRCMSTALDRSTRVPSLLGRAGSPELSVPLEHEELLVACKPPRWSVDSGEAERNSIASLGRYLGAQYPVRQFPVLSDLSAAKGFLHRLDVPSSGLILVAKSYRAYFDLQLQLQTGSLLREYVTMCHGWLSSQRASVRARVHVWRNGQLDHASVSPCGKVACTRLKVVGYFVAGASCCLLAIRLVTGRMHQIRLHMAHIGHPTLLDGKYSATSTIRSDGQCPRNFLHRYRLAFNAAGENVAASAPLPADLADFMQTCVAVGPRSATSGAAVLEWKKCPEWGAVETISPAGQESKTGRLLKVSLGIFGRLQLQEESKESRWGTNAVAEGGGGRRRTMATTAPESRFSGRLQIKGSKGGGLASSMSLGDLRAGPRRDLQAAAEARLSAAPFGVVLSEVPYESTLRSSYTLRDTQWPPPEGRTRIG